MFYADSCCVLGVRHYWTTDHSVMFSPPAYVQDACHHSSCITQRPVGPVWLITNVVKDGLTNVVKDGLTNVVKDGLTNVLKGGLTNVVKDGLTNVVKGGLTNVVKDGLTNVIKGG